MNTGFAASIKAYRAAAATRFLSASTSKTTPSTQHQSDPPQLPRQPPRYQRAQIPGIEEYLQRAANAYAKAKTLIEPTRPTQSKTIGHGEPVEHLYATVRRERWLRVKADLNHLIRVPCRVSIPDFVAPCGIPRDVLQRAAAQFFRHKKRFQETSPKPKPSGNVLGRRSVDVLIGMLDIREDPGFRAHIERCEDRLAAGKNVICTTRKDIYVRCDNFEDVRTRYAGRPDELYRRKTARKFATWRRRRREEEQMLRQHELNAEKEMKRRRGHDRLLSTRPTGDSSLAPFLVELGNNTYVYSSKISEAPKLRKMMIDKYTGCEAEDKPELDQWQRAQHVAEINPLFHTRVMNRFS